MFFGLTGCDRINVGDVGNGGDGGDGADKLVGRLTRVAQEVLADLKSNYICLY